MPTNKPSRRLFYSEEELQRLFAVWTDLRRVGRRRDPGYIGQKLTFNQWLKGLTAEGAARAQEALAGDNAAPSSGIVKETMATKTKTPKTSEAPKAAPPSPRRGRPPGRKKITVGFSLDPDVTAYAKALGSPKVNDLLRRSMRAAQRKSG